VVGRSSGEGKLHAGEGHEVEYNAQERSPRVASVEEAMTTTMT